MGNIFYFPTRLVLSKDAVTDLLQELGGNNQPRVIFLTDAGVLAAGLAAPFLQALGAAGIFTETYSQIPGNPNVQDMVPAYETAQKTGATHVVALGGGSVIDTAKAVGILLAHPGMDWEDLQWGRAAIKHPSFPVIAIPTTAGTGSEVTKVTVIGDHTGFKKGVLHPFVFVRTAIIDGSLTLSLPANLTAATGMDALVHAIEAYTGKRATPMADLFALAAIRAIVTWLPETTRNGRNLAARQAMSEAAAMAGIAFDQSGLALAHALGGPLTATYHLHHGLGIAALLPASLSFNAPAIPETRWAPLRDALGLPAQAQPEATLAQWARIFIGNLGLPVNLSEVGLRKNDIPQIAQDTTRMAMFNNNIRSATVDELISLLEANLG
jgi:alcohol dehydrogenase class IV